VETQMGENHIILSYIFSRIYSLEAPTSQFSIYNRKENTPPYLQHPTWRKLQLSEFFGSNQKEDTTPWFLGSNLKESPTPYVLWYQLEGGYNPLSFPCSATLKCKCIPNFMYHNHFHYHFYCHYHCHINLSLHPTCHCHQPPTINLSLSIYHINLSLLTYHCIQPVTVTDTKPNPRSPRKPINQMLKHHQNMPLPSKYQYNQHIIIRYVSQTCTKTVPYHVSNLYQIMYQTYTKSCTKIVPNHASIMYKNLYHTMYQTYSKSCINQNLCHTMCQHHIMHQWYISPVD